MDESIAEHHLGPGPIFHFSVDTSMPYPTAEKQFREQFERLKQKKQSAIQIDKKRFAKWCDYGLLPYIDLKQEEFFESRRQGNPKLATTKETMAEAIYKSRFGVTHTADTLKANTRPIAKDVMNPSSDLFRQLLAEASAEVSPQADTEEAVA
jgi:hypothetical protein